MVLLEDILKNLELFFRYEKHEEIIDDPEFFAQYKEFREIIDTPGFFDEYIQNNNGDNTGYEEYILKMFNSYNW